MAHYLTNQMGWLLGEPTQPDLLINEPKKFEPGPAHHGLMD